MKALGFIGAAVVGVAAATIGCGSASGGKAAPTTTVSRAPPPRHGEMAMARDMCPMEVAGATVTPDDVEGGVALAFTTSGGDVAELRQRVWRMGAMHNQDHAPGGMMMEGGGMTMPAATATVAHIEGGARVVLRPNDPAQLDALRDHVRTHADQMARGECPMMPPGGHAMPPPSARGADHMAHQPPAGD